MKTNLKTFAALLGFLALAAPGFAAPYSQPYTASFGVGQTGQASSVVYYVFDASGTLRVGPASYVNAAGATVTGPNNEPVVAESRDYTGTGGTGAYYATLPLDTAWGPLHIKAVIVGQAGVVAEGSLVNRGSDVVVSGYAAGQDPATLVFGASFLTIPGSHTTSGISETLTFKQWQALVDALPGGDNTSTAPVKSGSSTTTYYLRGQVKTPATVVAVSTVTYDANGNQIGRTVLTAQPFPAVN